MSSEANLLDVYIMSYVNNFYSQVICILYLYFFLFIFLSRFKPLSAKEVIHNVLFDQLSTKTYDAQDAIQWTKNIADILKVKIKGDRSSMNFIISFYKN